MDAVILKSRYLMIGFGIIFVALNVYNGEHLVIVTMALFLLNIIYKEITIMKRSKTIYSFASFIV